MAHAFAQVTLERTTGVPEDRVVNGFHFYSPNAITPAVAAAIAVRVERFYKTAAPPSANALSAYLSNVIATTGHTIKIYDQGQAIPRVPILTQALALTIATGSEAYPSEVALVCSLRAGISAGVVPARTRGRIYFGPVNVTTSTGTSAAGDARPTSAFMSALADSAKRLMDEGNALDTPQLAVFSKTDLLAGNETDGLRNVVQARVNNAWDTQRRRGADPTVNVDRFIAAV